MTYSLRNLFNSVLSLSILAVLTLPVFGHGSHADDFTPTAKNDLAFVANQNQWHERVAFKADLAYGHLYLENDRFTYVFFDDEDLEAVHELKHESKDLKAAMAAQIDCHAYGIEFVGANFVEPAGQRAFNYYHNYFLGDDPNKWVGGVPLFRTVQYDGIYPGTDLRIFTQEGNPKYEFVLAAGADPSSILLRYDGVSGMHLENGDLVYETSINKLREQRPYAYQIVGGVEVEIACEFALQGEEVTFAFPYGYDTNYELVIDPILLGASYSGQSGSSQYGFTATFDELGHIYGGGESFGAGFPTSSGAFQATFGGGVDIGVTKFSPDATTVLYATYIGGNSDDNPLSLIVNGNDNLIVMGHTGSTDYPTTSGAYDDSYNGATDILLTIFSPDGTTIEASTFIGGSGTDGLNNSFSLTPNYGDQNRGEVNLYGGQVYVSSVTTSTNFPTTSSAYQTASGGAQDACVMVLDSTLTTLVYSTYLGGSSDDAGTALKINSVGDVIAVGPTESSDFPTTAGVVGGSYFGGTADGFVAQLSPDLSSMVQSTFVGTSDLDISFFVEVDENDNIFIAGNSDGGNFPVIGPVYSDANSTQFIAKMATDFSSYVWSTVLGSGTSGGGFGSNELSPTAFLVDICGNIYLGGFTYDAMPTTPDAFQPTVDLSGDFYFAVLEPNATAQLYGTYMGGNGWEHVDGGTSRYDKRGILYQASCTNSTDFPTTPGAAYAIPGASVGWDRVVFKFDFEFAGVSAAFSSVGGVERGCAPLTVDFDNLSGGASNFVWYFGDGDSSNAFTPTHTFTTIGTYSVTLIASNDSSECAGSDTAMLTIIVHDDSLNADFTLIPDCSTLTIDLGDSSTTFGATTWNWDYGDGTTSGVSAPSYTYGAPGDYTVSLILTDPFTCNLADTLEIPVTLLPSIASDFTYLDQGCEPLDVNFSNGNAPPMSFEWEFGDGAVSADHEPSHNYPGAGTYSVSLVTNDPSSCNLSDTAYGMVTVHPLPTSDFNSVPDVPSIFTAVEFGDLSSGAATYFWDFGDGTTSTDADPMHQYFVMGTYTVCLTVTTDQGCEDTYCKDVNVDADSEIGIPNAFSPNGDNNNDQFVPIALGFGDYQMSIFNRWGDLIFESNSPAIGWDGMINGKVQEIGTYVYHIRGKGLDETDYDERGTFTLVR